MTIKTTFTLTKTRGEDLFSRVPALSKRTLLRRFANELLALAAGSGGGTGASDRTTIRYGTAGATGTITCASVVNANTLLINATTFTATQKHSRGTITPTVSGIDVDDTLLIDATTLTAKRHHATGTITPTVAGIDVDDTVTIGGTALTAKRHNATGTVTFASAASGDNIVVGATTFVATTGAVTPGQATYCYDTGDAEAATSFLAQVAAHAVASTVVTGTRSTAVVTLRAIATGVAGNSVILTSVDGVTTAVSGAGFLANAVAVGASQFDITGTDAQCCTSINAAVAANATIAALVTSTTTSTVVTLRAVATGVAGNAITLASSDAQIAVSDTTLLNATAVAANEFDITGTNAQCCTSILAAINASLALTAILTASTSATIVTIRNKTAGTAGDSVVLTSSDAQLAVSGAGTMTGGGAIANNVFDFGGTDAETAADLCRAINASSTALVTGAVDATVDSNVVTLTADFTGVSGNDVTLSSVGGTMTCSVSRLTGGTETVITF